MKKVKQNISTWGLLIFVFLLATLSINAQPKEEEHTEKVTINGYVFDAIIVDGDTIIMADLDNISISSPRKFKNREDYRRYRKYRYYGSKVFPYAQKAIKIFRDIEASTETMSKRRRKRFVRRKYRQLKREFKKPMKNLTKTQGKILIKMIEKELDTPFYDLMKDMKGGFTASYWNQMGKLFSYDLKQGYHEGDDPILDVVLSDFDISYKKGE
ncbi:MAG TPA: DUF4294 domain-containing protein [Phaeodactylibacter sp.]|nr:DUF4294 domain-containing protein [Phaeodactylibacter sp.]